MMDQKQEALLGLPLTNAEREWLTDRLETLSVKESYQLSAAIMRSGRLQELVGKNRDELQASAFEASFPCHSLLQFESTYSDMLHSILLPVFHRESHIQG